MSKAVALGDLPLLKCLICLYLTIFLLTGDSTSIPKLQSVGYGIQAH